jgi:hypothetical protein
VSVYWKEPLIEDFERSHCTKKTPFVACATNEACPFGGPICEEPHALTSKARPAIRTRLNNRCCPAHSGP